MSVNTETCIYSLSNATRHLANAALSLGEYLHGRNFLMRDDAFLNGALALGGFSPEEMQYLKENYRTMANPMHFDARTIEELKHGWRCLHMALMYTSTIKNLFEEGKEGEEKFLSEVKREREEISKRIANGLDEY